MQRITMGMLQEKVNHLNKITGNPLESWNNGKANKGCYTLSGAYGGHCLHQICNTSGGVHEVLNCGYIPKRDLFNQVDALIKGIHIGRG